MAVKVVSKVKQGEPDGHLVRPVNLERSADWCTKLSDDELSGILNKLPSWQDAARAAATCRTWRRLLKDGAWPANRAQVTRGITLDRTPPSITLALSSRHTGGAS